MSWIYRFITWITDYDNAALNRLLYGGNREEDREIDALVGEPALERSDEQLEHKISRRL